MKAERLWHPRMVTNYYDRSIFLSPWVLALTLAFYLLAMRVWHTTHNLWVVGLVVTLWLGLFVQHRWFKSDDPAVLRRMAAKSVLGYVLLYLITVGTLLSLVK